MNSEGYWIVNQTCQTSKMHRFQQQEMDGNGDWSILSWWKHPFFFFGFYQQTSVICSFNVQISPEMRCKKPGWGHGVLSPKSVPPNVWIQWESAFRSWKTPWNPHSPGGLGFQSLISSHLTKAVPKIFGAPWKSWESLWAWNPHRFFQLYRGKLDGILWAHHWFKLVKSPCCFCWWTNPCNPSLLG